MSGIVSFAADREKRKEGLDTFIATGIQFDFLSASVFLLSSLAFAFLHRYYFNLNYILITTSNLKVFQMTIIYVIKFKCLNFIIL